MGKSRRTKGIASFVNFLSSTSDFQGISEDPPDPADSKSPNLATDPPKELVSIDESHLLPCGSVVVEDGSVHAVPEDEDEDEDTRIEDDSARPAKKPRRMDEEFELGMAHSESVNDVDSVTSSATSTLPFEQTVVNGSGGRSARITGLLGSGYESVDATGSVPHYTHKSQVPTHLQKYFAQRYRIFSKYDEGCLLDEDGWFSVTPEAIADQIAERCRCDTIVDAFCGVGGNAIAFAKTCERVIALDTSPTRLALARHNATIYGVADRIEFILCDYLSFARSRGTRSRRLIAGPTGGTARKIDVVFLSPPWGGPEYITGSPIKPSFNNSSTLSTTTHAEFSLSSVAPIHGADLFALTRQNLSHNIAYYLPRNTSLQEIGSLVESENEKIEIEEEWMGNKLKALTCYFGGLVDGQTDMF